MLKTAKQDEKHKVHSANILQQTWADGDANKNIKYCVYHRSCSQLYSANFQACHENTIGFEVANKERKLAIYERGFETPGSGTELTISGSQVQYSDHLTTLLFMRC